MINELYVAYWEVSPERYACWTVLNDAPIRNGGVIGYTTLEILAKGIRHFFEMVPHEMTAVPKNIVPDWSEGKPLNKKDSATLSQLLNQ
jgi:hypothetical protein